MLVAFIAVEIYRPPVESLEHLISSTYHLAIQRDTAEANVFLKAKHGSIEHKIYESNKIITFAGDANIFIDQMVGGKKPDTLLWHLFQVAEFNPQYPCNLAHVERHNSKQSGGMLYKKNWPYTKLLSHHLLKMKESGLLDRLFGPYIKHIQQTCPTQQIIRPVLQKPKPVSVNTTFCLYLIIAAGLCGAFILLVIENLYYKCVHNVRYI